MKKNWLVLFMFISSTLAVVAQHDSIQVKNCFEEYKKYVLGLKGKEAVEYMDSQTINYYNDLLEKTKHLDSVGLDKTSFFTKLSILLIRLRVVKEEILKMDGKSLLVYSFDHDMTGTELFNQATIGKVDIFNNTAMGQIVIGGNAAPAYLKFQKETGKWKIALAWFFSQNSSAFKDLVDKSGKSENIFLVDFVKQYTGLEIKADTWKPLVN